MYDLKSPTVQLPRRSSACAAEGCSRECRSWSRYCTMHARRMQKTRDPNGRVFAPKELKPYRGMAADHLVRKRNHPAVLAATRYMQTCLNSPALPPAVQIQMRRLYGECAEPLEMLLRFLAVFGLMHFNAHSVGRDVVATFNLGRAVLLTVPMGKRVSTSGREYSHGLNARVCEAYGQILRDNLGRFATQFWDDIEKTIHGPALASAALRMALEEVPLSEDVR